MSATTQQGLICYHCGDKCLDRSFTTDDKLFCCAGCQTVHQVLLEGGLENYYKLERNPGVTQRNKSRKHFEYLDNPEVLASFIDFEEGETVRLTLTIPAIHCSSCVWLLENLDRLHDGIYGVRVNFSSKGSLHHYPER